MDNAVALVQAYLRINGYFTVAEYPILQKRGTDDVQMATDIDILAFRFPGAIREVVSRGRRAQRVGVSIPDASLDVPAGAADMVIGEVKEGQAHLNKSMRNPAVISAALMRFGCCDPGHADRVARQLLSSGRAETMTGHMVRVIVFASSGSNVKRFRFISLAHVTGYLRGYLRENWDVLQHAQFRDPVLSLLVTLEKAGDSSPQPS